MKKLLPSSEFNKNVLTLMTGTTLAQAIPIAISPILTRIYTPEDFGMFALFMSIASIVAIIATGRYELAIMLPKKDEDSINIVVLSILIAFFVSFITFLIVLIFNAQLTDLLKNKEISNWLYFIPLSILLTGVYQSFNYWSNRKKKYKRLASNRIIKSSTIMVSNLGFGLGGFGASGLIVGQLAGQGVALTILAKMSLSDNKKIFEKISKSKIINLAKRYINFPKFLIVAHGMNTISLQLPIILLSRFFDSAVVGFFMLSQRVIRLPMSVIAVAIKDVFRQKASYDYANKGVCEQIFIKTFKRLIIISFVPFLIFFFTAPSLFSFIFGHNWRIAGEYAQILTPMFFLGFVVSPLSSVDSITGNQKFDLKWQSSLFVLTLCSLIIGSLYNVKIALILYSIAYSIMYIIGCIFYYKFSKGKNDRQGKL